MLCFLYFLLVGASTQPYYMLKCVIFSEFDLKLGPVLRYQYPEYMSKEQFNTLSDILIPLPELCGKLITA